MQMWFPNIAIFKRRVCAGKAQDKPKITKKRRKNRKRKQRRKLITKEERTKERRERVTRCKSPSLSPVK